jgi:hypothetical protein
MCDLETLGKHPGCSILSIGAVAFDRQSSDMDNASTFYIVLDRKSCRRAGLVEEEDTVKWWMAQEPAARSVLDEAEHKGLIIGEALTQFSRWFRGVGSPNMWGNSPDFDMSILAAAYRNMSRNVPWDFWKVRCFRTIRDINEHAAVRGVGRMERSGTYHNALDDAMTQARYAQKILRGLA